MTLKQFSKNVKNLSKKEMDGICEKILREMALRFLTEVIRLTPVARSRRNYTGGTLRRGWVLNKPQRRLTNKTKPTPQEIERFVNTLKFKKVGKYYTITVTNPIEYAKFVNYGHRTRGGKGWVQGYHFVEKAEDYINKNQNKIFKRIFEEKLKRGLGL